MERTYDEGSVLVIVADHGNGPVNSPAEGRSDVVIAGLSRRRPDLGLVDALARFHLQARRLGYVVRVRRPGPELCELLALVGLSELVADAAERPEAPPSPR